MNPELEAAIERLAANLYTPDEWQQHISQYEDIGLSTELYDMRCHVLEELYELDPSLFDDINWMNDDNGMPLWVRPGVTWIPSFELDDND
jgi:hypothetical protein